MMISRLPYFDQQNRGRINNSNFNFMKMQIFYRKEKERKGTREGGMKYIYEKRLSRLWTCGIWTLQSLWSVDRATGGDGRRCVVEKHKWIPPMQSRSRSYTESEPEKLWWMCSMCYYLEQFDKKDHNTKCNQEGFYAFLAVGSGCSVCVQGTGISDWCVVRAVW